MENPKTYLSNIPISLLVKMVAALDLKDLTALRATNKHLRNMMNKPLFWEMYYRTVFGKPLSKENTFTWKDLSNLYFMVHDIGSMKFDEYMDRLMDINPQLIDTFLRLIGFNIVPEIMG